MHYVQLINHNCYKYPKILYAFHKYAYKFLNISIGNRLIGHIWTGGKGASQALWVSASRKLTLFKPMDHRPGVHSKSPSRGCGLIPETLWCTQMVILQPS